MEDQEIRIKAELGTKIQLLAKMVIFANNHSAKNDYFTLHGRSGNQNQGGARHKNSTAGKNDY